jgi:AcrR family transcriptional regulator
MHKPQARQRRRWGSTEAVLKAALHLTRKHGLANVSIEAIAARAGVGKQTIYRWWPSKGAVVFEAYLNEIKNQIQWTSSENLAEDLTAQLQRVLALLQDPAHGPTIANLVAEAQHDPEVERAMANAITQPYRKLTLQRLREAQVQRKIKRNTDLDLLADAIFAPAWMRLLMGVAPLAGVDARRHIAQLFEGVRPSKSGTES